MTGIAPRIVCLDLDTFFVSVERVLDPSLIGKAVVVGGSPGQRGVVTAASYEVRELGVRSGMSLTEAARLAPDAIYLPTRHDTYGEYAVRVREIAARSCPVVQVASIDEMYLDYTGCERLYRLPGDRSADHTIERVVRELTAAVRDELGLPASAGIATSKPMAKVACGLAKPEGVLLVQAGAEAATLAPLPVRKLPGIGPVSEQRLASVGITTLGQIQCATMHDLRRVFGAWAPTVQINARGQSRPGLGRDRPAFREYDVDGLVLGSISNQRTFFEDVADPDCIRSMLSFLTERVCWRARKRQVAGRTVAVTVRYADFDTLSRARTLSAATNKETDLLPVVMQLYGKARIRSLRIRLLGVALSNLELPQQLELFPRQGHLLSTVDSIRTRYGYDAVRRASSRQSRRPPA